jgi:hypothetical protein
MNKKYIAMCGLDCSRCNAFIATKNNNDDLRIKTAQEWTVKRKDENKPAVKPEDINCFGCLSENKPIYQNCLKCQIRKCGLDKGAKNCNECGEYKCDMLIELQKHFF